MNIIKYMLIFFSTDALNGKVDTGRILLQNNFKAPL